MKKQSYWVDIKDIYGAVNTIRIKDIRAIIKEETIIRVYLHIADDRLNIASISPEEYKKLIKQLKKND